MTFVVSPLISLIHDQLNNLHAKGISALTISSSLSEKQRREALRELNSPRPECKLFYITPEMLMRSQAFQSILRNLADRNMVSRYYLQHVIPLDLSSTKPTVCPSGAMTSGPTTRN